MTPANPETREGGRDVTGFLVSIEHWLAAAPGTPDNELGRQALASLRAAGLGAPTPNSDANTPQESASPVQPCPSCKGTTRIYRFDDVLFCRHCYTTFTPESHVA